MDRLFFPPGPQATQSEMGAKRQAVLERGALETGLSGRPNAAGRLTRRASLAGVALVAVGLFLLAGVGVYYGYGVYARSRLYELNVSVENYAQIPPWLDTGAISDGKPSQVSGGDGAEAGTGAAFSPELGLASFSPGTEVAQPPIRKVDVFATLYPGLQLHPKYWDQPLWAGTDLRQLPGLPDGYRPVSTFDAATPQGTEALAQRIRVPSIGVDSAVSELRILDLGDSRSYETPKNVVGHIPETPNPGARGNGWFFGHLESPIRGEGNVFRRLPDIPQQLESYIKTGENPVYVTLESQDGEYLYQVTATEVVHGDDLRLSDSTGAVITLVTCVPRFLYSHRLLVTAKLVGVKP